MNHRNVSTPSENASTAPNSPGSINLNSPINSPTAVINNNPTSIHIDSVCKNDLANMNLNNDNCTINNKHEFLINNNCDKDNVINDDYLQLDNFDLDGFDTNKTDLNTQYLPVN